MFLESIIRSDSINYLINSLEDKNQNTSQSKFNKIHIIFVFVLKNRQPTIKINFSFVTQRSDSSPLQFICLHLPAPVYILIPSSTPHRISSSGSDLNIICYKSTPSQQGQFKIHNKVNSVAFWEFLVLFVIYELLSNILYFLPKTVKHTIRV